MFKQIPPYHVYYLNLDDYSIHYSSEGYFRQKTAFQRKHSIYMLRSIFSEFPTPLHCWKSILLTQCMTYNNLIVVINHSYELNEISSVDRLTGFQHAIRNCTIFYKHCKIIWITMLFSCSLIRTRVCNKILYV